MYCNVCGSEIDDDSRFCPVCGSPVEPVSVPEQGYANPQMPEQMYANPQVEQTTPPSELPTTRVTVTGETDSLTGEESPKKEKGKKGKGKKVKPGKKSKWFRITVFAVAFLAVGTGVFFGVRYLINQKKNDFQVYYKKPSQQDIEIPKDGGRAYVKKQLIVEGTEECTRKKMEKLAEGKNGSIVGIISTVQNYQIEFEEGTDKAKLDSIISEWSSNSIIARVDYHYAYQTEGGFYDYENDVWWNDSDGEMPSDFEEDWDIYNPRGNNWAVESIWAPAVWNPKGLDLGDYGTVEDTTYEKVKVGLLDTTFDRKHKDLTDRFTEQTGEDGKGKPEDSEGSEGSEQGKTTPPDIAGQYGPYSGRYGDPALTDTEKAEEKRLSHGTHIAGIIGANINDKFGIAGIAQNSELYGFGLYEDSGSGTTPGSGDGQRFSSDFIWKCELAILFDEDVRLINISMQLDEADGSDPAKSMEQINGSMERFLLHYLEQEDPKDFLIVKSAGDSAEPKEDLSGEFLAGIKNEKVKDHILVVGGATYHYDEFGALASGDEYRKTDTSNFGDRIDIYGPAVETLSDIPGDRVEMRSGTSEAAAYVTGGCALVMGAAPKLSMTEVKKIVCSNYLFEVKGTGKGYLNVFLIAEEAKARAKDGSEEVPGGTTQARVSDSVKKALYDLSEKKAEGIMGQIEIRLSAAFKKEITDYKKLTVSATNGSVTKKMKFNKKGIATLSVEPGKWTVTAKSDGYDDKEIQLDVEAGKAVREKNFSLQKTLSIATVFNEKVKLWYPSTTGNVNQSIEINPDGTFIYESYDLNMGFMEWVTSKCTGTLSDIEVEDELCYKVKIANVKSAYSDGQNLGTDEDGFTTVAEDPYLKDGMTVYIFVPGTAVSDVPGEMKTGIAGQNLSDSGKQTLEYAIYVDTGTYEFNEKVAYWYFQE